jgi:hypothetical protein
MWVQAHVKTEQHFAAAEKAVTAHVLASMVCGSTAIQPLLHLQP